MVTAATIIVVTVTSSVAVVIVAANVVARVTFVLLVSVKVITVDCLDVFAQGTWIGVAFIAARCLADIRLLKTEDKKK